MGKRNINRHAVRRRVKGAKDDAPPLIVIIVSRYNWSITGKLLEGARRAYHEYLPGFEPVVIEAPGAFEIPVLCEAAATNANVIGIVALGCIIQGETIHDRVLADAVTPALLQIGINTGVVVTLGILTVDSMAQAEARAGGAHGNKGEEAMHAAFQTLFGLSAAIDGKSFSLEKKSPDKGSGDRPDGDGGGRKRRGGGPTRRSGDGDAE